MLRTHNEKSIDYDVVFVKLNSHCFIFHALTYLALNSHMIILWFCISLLVYFPNKIKLPLMRYFAYF